MALRGADSGAGSSARRGSPVSECSRSAGLRLGSGSVYVCAQSQRKARARLCGTAEGLPRRGFNVSSGGALACDVPTSGVANVPYDLAQNV